MSHVEPVWEGVGTGRRPLRWDERLLARLGWGLGGVLLTFTVGTFGTDSPAPVWAWGASFLVWAVWLARQPARVRRSRGRPTRYRLYGDRLEWTRRRDFKRARPVDLGGITSVSVELHNDGSGTLWPVPAYDGRGDLRPALVACIPAPQDVAARFEGVLGTAAETD